MRNNQIREIVTSQLEKLTWQLRKLEHGRARNTGNKKDESSDTESVNYRIAGNFLSEKIFDQFDQELRYRN